ncbi:chaplin [Streptomyces sp. NPDC006430]|uniref:chaplin n=1 Tax=Streptomyces sp. NPDC006430 TaxID=3154299 RepID=UPI0033AC6BBC
MRQVLSRQVLSKGMLTAAAASSLLSIATGAAYAHPGATAEASHSPGVLSGNSVSVPITLSPNVCGNSVNVGAALNPAMGNSCATTTGSDVHRDLDDRQGGRHALPEQRHEEPPQEDTRRQAPRHAAPRHEEPRDEGGDSSWDSGRRGHGEQGGYDGSEKECDDHPHTLPAPAPAHHVPPAPERPRPRPHTQPRPVPAPLPAPIQETPVPLPAPVPVPERVAPPTLAETGAGQAGAAAALASALILGGVILYRRSRIA